MKQYLTPEQTSKLIELGVEPKTKLPFEVANDELGYTYSIGELIEMLPTKIEAEVTDEYDSETAYLNIEEGWAVSYFNGWCTVEKCTRATELIDALYDMAVKLKEEGVI